MEDPVAQIFSAHSSLAKSRDPSKVRLAAVASAVTSTVAETAGSAAPTAPMYIAALLTSLSTPASDSAAAELLKLFAASVQHAPKTLLHPNLPALSKSLSSLLKRTPDSNPGVLRSASTAAKATLLTLLPDPALFKSPAGLGVYHVILSLLSHRSPKVRKHAAADAIEVLSSDYSPSLGTHVATFLEDILAGVTAGNATDLLKVFPYLARALPLLPARSVEALTLSLLKLLTLDNAHLTASTITALADLYQSAPDGLKPGFLESLLASLLKTSSGHVPKSNVPAFASYIRLVSSVAAVVPSGKSLAEAAISTLISAIDHPDPSIPALSIAEIRKLLSVTGSLDDAKVEAALGRLLTLPFHPHLKLTLPLISDLASPALVQSAVALMPGLNKSSNRVGQEAVRSLVSGASGTMGIAAFLNACPLTTTSTIPSSSVWLLHAAMKSSPSAPSSLAHFRDTILPLARAHDKAASSPNATSVESNQHRQRVADAWALLPLYCRLSPPDVEDVFPKLAQILVKAVQDKRYPSVLLSVCSSIRLLVDAAADDSTTYETLSPLASKVMPTLFNVLEALDHGDTQSSQRASSLTQTVASYSTVAPKPFLASLFKKVMNRLLASTSAPPLDTKKVSTFLDLSTSLVPILEASEVSLLYRSLKPLVRASSDSSVQKRAYRALLALFENHASAVLDTDQLDDVVSFLSDTLLTSHVSARNARLKCLDHAVRSFTTKEQADVIPGIIGEVILSLKDSNAKTRESAYALLLSMCEARGDMPDFYQILVGSLGGKTPHMRSAGVMAISRVVYEYAREDPETQALLPDLLETVLTLFRENAREVIKSVVGFVRICVAALEPERLEPLLPQVVDGLMKWNSGKDRFRAKIKIILKKLVRRYGYQRIQELVPKDDTRLITHMRKSEERALRKRERGIVDDGKSQFGGDDYEDMMDSDEEDSDGGKTLMTGMTGFTKMTAKSGKTLRSAAEAKSERSAAKSRMSMVSEGGTGGGKILLQDGDVDMLDASVSGKMKYVDNDDDWDNDDSDDEVMEFDDKGRLMVNGDSEPDSDGDNVDELNRGALLEDAAESRRIIDSNENKAEAGGRRMKYELAQQKASEGDRKRRKLEQKNAPGAAFKSKKAGGDVKKKGAKFEPYAYIPLDGKSYTKKHRAAAVKNMSHVVKGKSGGGKRKRGRD